MDVFLTLSDAVLGVPYFRSADDPQSASYIDLNLTPERIDEVPQGAGVADPADMHGEELNAGKDEVTSYWKGRNETSCHGAHGHIEAQAIGRSPNGAHECGVRSRLHFAADVEGQLPHRSHNSVWASLENQPAEEFRVTVSVLFLETAPFRWSNPFSD
ncbi:MAG TPA: hypothetical protein VHK24_06690 [Steroidobacter sp.]|jgi:hypothetical protein|nr:hypothetical protein [Steroidobacter sp.]